MKCDNPKCLNDVKFIGWRDPGTAKHRYCSKACKDLCWYDWARPARVSNNVRNWRKERQCMSCGTTFMIRSSKQQLCIVCAPNHSAMTRFITYKLSQPAFDEMMCKQNNACAICKIAFIDGKQVTKNGKTHQPDIDHCHETGVVRGVLCRACNLKLALLDDENWIALGRAYLAKQGIA